MPGDVVMCPLGGAPGLNLTSAAPGSIIHTIVETNNNVLEKTPLIIKINPAPPQLSLYGGKGKRRPSGPIVTTSDEEESQESPRTSLNCEDVKETVDEVRTFSPPFLDHDYENVSSPGNSSTASGPTYVRQPGFVHHAHEITVSKPKVKKKKTAILDMKDGLRRRDPTPPKNKPKREPLPMRMRALPQSFWQQPNVAHNVSPAAAYRILPPLSSFYNREDEEIPEVRPISPPNDERAEKDRSHKSHRPVERKLTVANTDLLFKLFENVEKDKKPPPAPPKEHLKRCRRKVVPVAPTTNKSLVSGEDPYLVDCVQDKLFPQLRLEQTKGSTSNPGTLHIITFGEGDKSVTLPSLQVDQNYSQMLSELVAHI